MDGAAWDSFPSKEGSAKSIEYTVTFSQQLIGTEGGGHVFAQWDDNYKDLPLWTRPIGVGVSSDISGAKVNQWEIVRDLTENGMDRLNRMSDEEKEKLLRSKSVPNDWKEDVLGYAERPSSPSYPSDFSSANLDKSWDLYKKARLYPYLFPDRFQSPREGHKQVRS